MSSQIPEVLVERTAWQVLKDVLEQYFRPTGDLKEFQKKYPGTAPPPAELSRCLDFYTAVNARHYTNYTSLRQVVYDKLHAAIVRTENDGGRYAAMPTGDAVTNWINGSGSDETRVRAVFEAAITVTE